MDELERDLDSLRSGAPVWAAYTLAQRIAVLREVAPRIVANAQRWVERATRAKGLPAHSPLAGEEWLTGPYGVLYALHRYIRTLESLQRCGDSAAPPVRQCADGTGIARVFPVRAFDRLLFSGVSADVRVPAHVTTARYYRQEKREPRVALVLGAGNVAAIGPLDVLYKLIADGAVCILKMNPVNEYLAPVYNDVFAPLVERNFLRIVTGGADVGKFLTAHAAVDEIHITGSAQTHDAIVFADAQKTSRRVEKPVTSELGNVSPTIVLPGRWSRADLRFQAENVVTQKLHNAGFNCVAAQVLVLPRDWELREAFEAELEAAFARAPQRPQYYPGALERRAAHGAPAASPIVRVDAAKPSVSFDTEAFCAMLAITTLPSSETLAYLRDAVAFANERLAGTLGANVIADPRTQRDLGSALDGALRELRFGTVAVNAWTGVAFLLAEAPWGAYPGHTLEDVQSGIGIVHNAFLFDDTVQTIVRAPFRPFPRSIAHGEFTLLPKPPWFVTNRRAETIAKELLAFEARPGWLKLPRLFAEALRG